MYWRLLGGDVGPPPGSAGGYHDMAYFGYHLLYLQTTDVIEFQTNRRLRLQHWT